MGKKYIIELEDKPFNKGNGDFLYRVKGFNSLVFDMNGVGKLTPYAELDLEQVREEEYAKGYKTAKCQCNIQAEKDLREVGERHYQKGLSDAWAAARKIADIPYAEEEKVFGSGGWTFILNHTAQDAIDRIKAYEQKKQEEIKVGDEVIVDSGKCVVLVVDKNGFPEKLLEPDGYTLTLTTDVKLPKTGRHFPEIAEVLQKMKEDTP